MHCKFPDSELFCFSDSMFLMSVIYILYMFYKFYIMVTSLCEVMEGRMEGDGGAGREGAGWEGGITFAL